MQLSSVNASARFGSLHRIPIQFIKDEVNRYPSSQSFFEVGDALCKQIMPEILQATGSSAQAKYHRNGLYGPNMFMSPTLLGAVQQRGVYLLCPDKDDAQVTQSLQKYIAAQAGKNLNFQYSPDAKTSISDKAFAQMDENRMVALSRLEETLFAATLQRNEALAEWLA